VDIQNRIRTKNEATGMRIVSQYVQEFWECGWQPFDARNDRGIDGLILMRRKNQDLGVKINVQVKCGAKYISSFSKNEIKISIDNEAGLFEHINYWRKQNEPAILVFVNPCKPQRDKNGNIEKDDNGRIVWVESRKKSEVWWVNLKDDSIKPENTKTLIRICRNNVFGEHSKGEFLKLINPLLSNSHLPKLSLTTESKNLLHSQNLKRDSREFYKNWKNAGDVFCKAFNRNIRISKTGWRHIVSARRGKERRTNSLKLLGVAKQMINNIESYYLLNQKEFFNELEQKYSIRAVIEDKHMGQQTVQVILLRKLDLKSKKEKWWFYSVHYRR
jgi:hypothetical protein